MKRSEIFEEFVKIAQEQKIISNDSKKSRQALEKNPRADSLDITAIEALYGVKPKQIPELNYKNNIMEVAHPNSLVISPAYDKINGLVENNIERQNINLRIVNKNPDGLLTQRKYAQQQLLLSLVRVANDLDNKDQYSLLSLADHCLNVASNNFMKNAFLAPVVGLLSNRYLIGALIGASFLYNNLPSPNEGFPLNSDNLVKKVDALKNYKPGWGLGYELKPRFVRILAKFKKMLEDFKNKYNKYIETFNKVDGLIEADLDKSIDKAKTTNSSEADKIAKAYDDLKLDIGTEESPGPILSACINVQKAFSKPGYINRQIREGSRGAVQEYIDKAKAYTGNIGLIGDHFNDVVQAIPPYINSIKEMMQTLQEADKRKVEAEKSYTPDDPISAEDDDKPNTNTSSDDDDPAPKGNIPNV